MDIAPVLVMISVKLIETAMVLSKYQCESSRYSWKGLYEAFTPCFIIINVSYATRC